MNPESSDSMKREREAASPQSVAGLLAILVAESEGELPLRTFRLTDVLSGDGQPQTVASSSGLDDAATLATALETHARMAASGRFDALRLASLPREHHVCVSSPLASTLSLDLCATNNGCATASSVRVGPICPLPLPPAVPLIPNPTAAAATTVLRKKKKNILEQQPPSLSRPSKLPPPPSVMTQEQDHSTLPNKKRKLISSSTSKDPSTIKTEPPIIDMILPLPDPIPDFSSKEYRSTRGFTGRNYLTRGFQVFRESLYIHLRNSAAAAADTAAAANQSGGFYSRKKKGGPPTRGKFYWDAWCALQESSKQFYRDAQARATTAVTASASANATVSASAKVSTSANSGSVATVPDKANAGITITTDATIEPPPGDVVNPIEKKRVDEEAALQKQQQYQEEIVCDTVFEMEDTDARVPLDVLPGGFLELLLSM